MTVIKKVNVDLNKLKNVNNYQKKDIESISLTKKQDFTDSNKTTNFEKSDYFETIYIDNESSKVKHLPKTINIERNNDGTQTIREVYDSGSEKVIKCDSNGNVIDAAEIVRWHDGDSTLSPTRRIDLNQKQDVNVESKISIQESEYPETIHIDSESSKVKHLPKTINIEQNNDGTQTIREVYDSGSEKVIKCDSNGNVIDAIQTIIM